MTPTTVYLAVGPYCWGRGTSKAQAIKRARINWPGFPRLGKATDDKFNVYESDDPKIYVDEMGRIRTRKGAAIKDVQISSLVDPELAKQGLSPMPG